MHTAQAVKTTVIGSIVRTERELESYPMLPNIRLKSRLGRKNDGLASLRLGLGRGGRAGFWANEPRGGNDDRKLAAFRGYHMGLALNVLSCVAPLAGTVTGFTQVKADEINRRQFEGASIVWAYNIHPYTDAVAAQLSEFEKPTGITSNAA
ncbi:hypothetical protein [Bradyrhizobium embrapense]|uniref:hypothetical protein n=1 Tax=Bradyrhizobium embrapense TaxID=630921 RepID=UPI001FCD2E15|nr:hypothetical protein [Bradyrhizobium embrapense]